MESGVEHLLHNPKQAYTKSRSHTHRTTTSENTGKFTLF